MEGQEQERKPGVITFGAAKKPLVQPAVNFNAELVSFTTRLRVLEGKFDNLRRKIQFIEQNFLETRKKELTEVKTINSDIKDLKMEFEDIKSVLRNIVDETGKFAKLEDFKVLQKYISYWEPLNFVTHDQCEKLINEKFLDFKQQQDSITKKQAAKK